MRLALASQPVRNGDVAWNVRCMEDVLRACSGRADTVVFGESVLQGFDCLRWDYARDCTVAAAWTDEPVPASAGRGAGKRRGGVVRHDRARGRWALQQSGLPRRGRRLIDVFRRVSVGWKDVRRTDRHYREGDGFHLFSYGGIRFATALCGDLWTPGRPEELAALGADAVLWPVWCDYPAAEWNEQVKLEYAAQASRCGCPVLYVNPFCVDPDARTRQRAARPVSQAAGSSAKPRQGRAAFCLWNCKTGGKTMQDIQIGRVYRHFKGDYYLVEGVAQHSETGEPYVIYRKLYGDGGLWIRPLAMFLSPVDREKYPDAQQNERFALQEIQSVNHK